MPTLLVPYIAGYGYGKVQRSPVTLNDLRQLRAVVGFTDSDRQEGANNVALAQIDFESLDAYEKYRERPAADKDARANVAHAKKTQCILVEDRTFLERA
jgi:hypothetical protein